MVKKGKGGGQVEPNSASTVSRDVHQRLNYLYQSSLFLATALDNPSSPTSKDKKGKGKQKELQDDPPPPAEFLIPTQATGPTTSDSIPFAQASAASMGAIIRVDDEEEEEEEEERPILPTSTPVPPPAPLPPPKKKKKKPIEQVEPRTAVSRMLVKTMREVAKKATVRMDPSVKRTLCKKCHQILIPGVTCKVRIKPSGPHAHLLIKTCFNCKTSLRLPAPPHILEEDADGEEDGGMEVDGEKKKKLTKREKREKRQARKPTFFEREGHVTFVGSEKVTKNA